MIRNIEKKIKEEIHCSRSSMYTHNYLLLAFIVGLTLFTVKCTLEFTTVFTFIRKLTLCKTFF